MRSVLEGFEISGVPTTIPFHRQVLVHEDFVSGRVTTRWVEEKFLPSLAGTAPLAPAAGSLDRVAS